MAQRTRLPDVAAGGTTAFRVVDGAADGFPGVEIDNYGGHWVVQTRDVPFPAALEGAVTAGLCRSLWWKKLDQRDKRAPQVVAGAAEAPLTPFLVKERGLNCEVDLTAGYSQGLFMDQRPQRERMRERLRPGDRVLNLFAYTCVFSAAAAARGAETTSVDLSRPYLDWGRRNFQHNGLDPEAHFFCRGDVFEWLKRFVKKGRTWRGVVVDPPTFSRNAKGEVFRVERDFPALAAACFQVLEPGGWLLASTNHRGLTPSDFRALVQRGAALAGRRARAEQPGTMPPDFTAPPYLKSLWVEA